MRDNHTKQERQPADGGAIEERQRRPIEDYGAKALAAWQQVTQYRLSDMYFYLTQAADLRDHANRSVHPQIRSKLFAVAETYERMAEAIEQATRATPWRVGDRPRQPASQVL